uniref:Uncharacterized protein n=1 Tax=Klebsiella phage vB_KpnM_Iguana_ER37 TaxID=3076781 RepID=A0AB38Z4T2_9CAUD
MWASLYSTLTTPGRKPTRTKIFLIYFHPGD